MVRKSVQRADHIHKVLNVVRFESILNMPLILYMIRPSPAEEVYAELVYACTGSEIERNFGSCFPHVRWCQGRMVHCTLCGSGAETLIRVLA